MREILYLTTDFYEVWVREGDTPPAGATPTGETRDVEEPSIPDTPQDARRGDRNPAEGDTSSDDLKTPQIEPSTCDDADSPDSPAEEEQEDDLPSLMWGATSMVDLRAYAVEGIDFHLPEGEGQGRAGQWRPLTAEDLAQALPLLDPTLREGVARQDGMEVWQEPGGSGWAIRTPIAYTPVITAIRDVVHADPALRSVSIRGERGDAGRYTAYAPTAVKARVSRGKKEFAVLMDATRAVVEDASMAWADGRRRERSWVVARAITGSPARLLESSISPSDFPRALCTFESITMPDGEKIEVMSGCPIPVAHGIDSDSLWVDLRLPAGMTPGSVPSSAVSALQGLMGSTRTVVAPDPTAKLLRVKLPRTGEKVSWPDTWNPSPKAFPRATTQGGAMAVDVVIPVGRTIDGEVITADLASSPHALVVGTTGSGKSWTSLSWISALLAQGAEVIVCDGKNSGDYISLARHGTAPGIRYVASTMPEIARAIFYAESVMNRRQAQVSELKASGYAGKTPAPPLIVMIDEVAEVVRWSKAKENKEIGSAVLSAIDSILRLGRSLRVHLILATQDPRDDSIPNAWLANTPIKIVLGKATPMAMQKILNIDDPAHPALSSIPTGKLSRGKGTIKLSDGKREVIKAFQAPHIWSPDKTGSGSDETHWDEWQDCIRSREVWSPRIAPQAEPGWDDDLEALTSVPMVALDALTRDDSGLTTDIPRPDRAVYDRTSTAFREPIAVTRRVQDEDSW